MDNNESSYNGETRSSNNSAIGPTNSAESAVCKSTVFAVPENYILSVYYCLSETNIILHITTFIQIL